MKKLLVYIIALCLVLSLVFVMAACNDSTDSSGKEGGGNTDNGTASGTFDYQASAVAGQLDAMRRGGGYLIRYRATGTEVSNDFEEVTLGAKGNIYYVGLSDEECFYDITNAEYAAFYSKEEGGAWQKSVMYYGAYYTQEQAMSAMQAYFNAHSSWLTYYQAFTSSMSSVTKSTGTVAGRSCDKFTFTAAALTGKGLGMASATYACYVDKATSICLKWEASATVEGKTESYGMECVEFNANPTFTLPAVSQDNTTVTGRADVGGDDNQGGNQGGDDNQGGTNTNQGTTPSGDNGTTPSGDNGGSQGGDASVQTVTLATRASILSAIGTTYKVVATDPYTSAVTTVASDGTYFYTTAPYEYFGKLIGEYLYGYGSLWDGKYYKLSTPTYTASGEAHTMLGRGNVRNILQFDGETLQYNTVEAVTFLGRNAKKYTFDSTNAYGYNISFHEEVTIDDLTGACLKYASQGTGTSSGTRNKESFEVTEFSYGDGNAAARTFLDGYIAKIDVYEWDADFIVAVGLSAVDRPLGQILFSQWEDKDETRDSEAPYWQAQYKLYSDTQAEYQDYIRQFCLAFYNAGARIDYGAHQAEFDDLYSPNGGWDDVNLTAYIVGNTSYQVYVSATYVTYSTPHYWLINVEIRLDE